MAGSGNSWQLGGMMKTYNGNSDKMINDEVRKIMAGKLKRTHTNKIKFVILAFLAVMMIVGIGMPENAAAYVAGDVIYINAASSTYAPGSGTNFTITVTLTDFAGNGVSGKGGDYGLTDGVYINKVTDVNKTNATTTFPLADGTGWTDNGDGTYTVTGNITGSSANSPYNMEIRFDDPTSANYSMKAYVMLTVGGTASSADMGTLNSAPDFTYYPFPAGTVTLRLGMKNQDASAHTTAVYDTAGAGLNDGYTVRKLFDVTSNTNVTYTIGTVVNNGDGTYDVPINYSGAPTDNEIYLVEVRYEWDGAGAGNVRHGTNFAFEINSTQAPTVPTGAPPSNPECPECTPSTGPTINSGATPSATDSGTHVDSPFTITTQYDQGGATTMDSCQYTTNGTFPGTAATLTNTAGTTWECTTTTATCTDGVSLQINMQLTYDTSSTLDAAVANRTCDTVAPATTDNTPAAWSASEITVTLSPTDAGAGVTAATGIYGCTDTGVACTPAVLGGNTITTACGAGSECSYNVRYYSVDDVNNTETTNVAANQAKVDRLAPTDGTLSITPGNLQNDLSWSGFSDGGSGMNTTDAYKLVYNVDTTFPSAGCIDGTEITAVTTGSAYSHSGLVDGSTYFYRLCGIDEVGNVSSTGATASQTASSGPVYTISSCSGCHALPVGDATTRGTPTGAVIGSHSVTEHLAATCTNCHVDNGLATDVYPKGLAHREGMIEMITDIHGQTGASYSKGTSFAQSKSPTLGNCSSTFCHGSGSPTWGSDLTSVSTCVKCHGDSAAVAPTEAEIAPGGTGVDTNGDSLNTDQQVGAHQSHLTNTGIRNSILCQECHTKPAAVSDSGHIDDALPADMTFNGPIGTTGGLTPAYDSPAAGQCSSTWCHAASLSDGDNPPTWSSPFSGTNADCDKCHLYPPPGVTDHSGLSPVAGSTNLCDSCHGHVNTTDDGFIDITKHIDGTIDGGSCYGCHNQAQDDGTPPARRSVMPEFMLNTAIGHMQYDLSAAADATLVSDCALCHDENALQHKNNQINPSSTNRTGTLTVADIETPTATFCIDCHKSGATNSQFSAGLAAVNINSAWTSTYNHSAGAGASECMACHGKQDGTLSAHGSSTVGMLKAASQSDTCFLCHNATQTNTGTSQTDYGYPAAWNTIPNLSTQFALTQLAYHPVLGAGLNQPADGLNAEWTNSPLRKDDTAAGGPFNGLDNNFVDGWTSSSLTACTDCHSNSAGSDAGPHGSAAGWILKTADPDVTVTVAGDGGATIPNGQVLYPNRIDGTATGTSINTYTYTNYNNCVNCHRGDIYNWGSDAIVQQYADGTYGGSAGELLSRLQHAGGDMRTRCAGLDGTAMIAGTANQGEAGVTQGTLAFSGCLNCHGGAEVAGIHGSSMGVGTQGTAQQGVRFMNGNSWAGYTKITTGGATSCYTGTSPGAAGANLSTCQGKHTTGRGVTANYTY